MLVAISRRTKEQVATHSNYESLLRVLYETSAIGETYFIYYINKLNEWYYITTLHFRQEGIWIGVWPFEQGTIYKI